MSGYGATEVAQPIGGRQPIAEAERALVDEAYQRLEVWRDGCKEAHDRAKEARRIARLDDPRQDPPGTPGNQRTLQLQTLKATLNNCVADQLDNMPEARLIPERPALRDVADDLTDIIKFVLKQNGFEAMHARRVEDFFVTGTAVTQISWDEEMDGGKGNVAVLRWPIEGFLWDPAAEDIQDGRACVKVSWHPLSWYAAHFPDEAPYVREETYAQGGIGVPDAWSKKQIRDEPRAMLMEYWYRKYDAGDRRYRIHVAYIAGRALLYASEREKPKGIYSHGRYPFVLDVFSRIEGLPVGEGMVQELAPMMRYINRYAHYIDQNLRMASKVKLLVRRQAGIDVNALTDMNQVIVEGDSVNPEDIHPYVVQQFSGAAQGTMLQMQTDMKQDSGQNQFTRGETAGGVNAASAIAMLQEAGGKVTRQRTQTLNQGFERIVEQVVWLVSDFYTDRRTYMVTGRYNQQRQVEMDADRLYGGDPEGAGTRREGRGGKRGTPKAKGALPPPPYSVQVQVQRRNPLRVQARNETALQIYTMAAQMAGNTEMQAVFPLSTLFQILDMEGKDETLPLIKLGEQKRDVMLQQARIMAEQERKLLEQEQAIGNLTGALRKDAQAAGQGTVTGTAAQEAAR